MAQLGAVSPFVPLSEPVIAGNEWKYVKECLDTGWVSSVGTFVDRFERDVADYVGAAEGVAIVNGTAALHTALLVAGVAPGDEVLVSDLTFVAPVNAIRYCGAHPVFMDAHPDTWQMDPSKVERFLRTECRLTAEGCVNRRTGRRVKAIVPVHILGLACEIDRIVASAGDYRLAVVEDATESMGVRYNGRHVGTFGDIGTFSFNGNKIITTGGGGVLVTDNAQCAQRARYLTTQAKDDPAEYVHNEVGFNYRLTNVLAAIGVAQLEQLDGFIERKRAIASRYELALAGIEHVTPMPCPPKTISNYWLYTMLLRPGTTRAQRQAVVKSLNASGIGARPLWHPIHGLPPYRDCQAYQIEHAVRLSDRAISLPSGVGLTEEQLHRCIEGVRRCTSIS